jgi:phospholipase/carboxylesterase
VSSLHHVTTIASDAQANVDFYSGFLGLRLIKRTAGAEDPRQLHLFYGDGVGSPGTLVTSLIWESAGAGRAGHGAAGELALAVPMDGISYWLTRCLDHRVDYEGPTKELGETVLRLKDPDGLIVKLVAAEGLPEGAFWRDSPVSCEAAIRGVRAVTLFSETADDTVRFLETRFDMRTLMEEGTIRRLAATDGRAMDVRDAEGFWPAAAGAGTSIMWPCAPRPLGNSGRQEQSSKRQASLYRCSRTGSTSPRSTFASRAAPCWNWRLTHRG